MHCHLSMKDTLQLLLQPLSIYYFAGLLGCLFVTNKRQNGSTDQAKFVVGPRMTPAKVFGCSKLQKSCIQKLLIFVKFKKCAKNYLKIRERLLLFCTVQREDDYRKSPN